MLKVVFEQWWGILLQEYTFSQPRKKTERKNEATPFSLALLLSAPDFSSHFIVFYSTMGMSMTQSTAPKDALTALKGALRSVANYRQVLGGSSGFTLFRRVGLKQRFGFAVGFGLVTMILSPRYHHEELMLQCEMCNDRLRVTKVRPV